MKFLNQSCLSIVVYLFWTCGFFSISLNAQWIENFDHDLSYWKGDTSHFNITVDHQLMLNANAAGTSFIFRPFEYQSVDQVWTIFLRMNFSPSSTNKFRWWLAMDQTDLQLANGYYLDIGENGNEDNWKLFAKSGNKINLIAEGIKSSLSTDPAVCRLKLIRDSNFNWIIESDYSGNENFIQEGQFIDTVKIDIQQSFMGLHCTYTDTRKDKFILDDISISSPAKDTLAPEIINAIVTKNRILQIEFNEEVVQNNALDTMHYWVADLGHPQSVSKDSIVSRLFHLQFKSDFERSKTYSLAYRNQEDLLGNKLTLDNYISFKSELYNEPQPGDLLINEFLADPVPSVGIPEFEFIEIWNTSDQYFDLKNYKILDGTSESSGFSPIVIEPNEYLILCNVSDTTAFITYGKTLGIRSLPTINNTADVLRLVNSQGEILHEVIFDLSLLGSSSKKDGGFTVELQKPNQYCKGLASWGFSESPVGGTPGKINSFIDRTIDQSGPVLLDLIPLSKWEIKIVLDEPLHNAQQGNMQLFEIDNGVTIATADPIAGMPQSIILVLNQALLESVNYTFRLSGAKDCLGNESLEQTISFQLPTTAQPGDLLWNEVMFNPRTGGSDFVELYNRSTKKILIKELFISNPQSSPNPLRINLDIIMSAGDYLVLTPDRKNIIEYYPIADSNKIFEFNIPSLDDKSGSLVLSRPVGNTHQIIDSFSYSSDWHSPLIKDENGVSLEKIRPDLNSYIKNHWQSASSQVNYGSPGLRNSQFLDSMDHSKSKPYQIIDKIISPNNDGYRDFLSILFDLDQAGYKIRAEIFNPSGYLVRTLSQETIGPENLLIWSGDDDQGNIITSGNYLLQLLLTHPDGKRLKFTELLVVDRGP
ncbi:MAG: lamin tail domain-containing protein [Saprospiraceae bacterium]|nr:lamin tail domain-containing protein [Saprospiraceae bacterium]